jgi:hypothetical protein
VGALSAAFTENDIQSGNGKVTITWNDTLDPVGLVTGLLPPVSPQYPSDDCAGSAVFDGYAGGEYLKLRTDSVGGTTSVCVALDSGTSHFGGKVSVSGGTPGSPIDGSGNACDQNPGSRVRDQEGFVSVFNYDIDVNVSPNASDAVWVCVKVTNTLDNSTPVFNRLVIRTATPSGTGFTQDVATAHPIVGSYVPAPNPGTASSYCQVNGGTRLINADIGPAHVWEYTASENGGTRQHLCLRGQSGLQGAGEHLTVDGGGGQNFVTVNQQDVNPGVFNTYCNIPVFGNTDPYIFLKAGTGGLSAYGCVGLLTINKLITLTANPGGSQTLITHAED